LLQKFARAVEGASNKQFDGFGDAAMTNSHRWCGIGCVWGILGVEKLGEFWLTVSEVQRY
jgi:hypothetical protein